MKAALKGKYDLDKNGGAAATVAFNAGDMKLRASITDATVINGPSLTGLALALEKPGHFIFDYNVPKKVLPQKSHHFFTSFLLPQYVIVHSLVVSLKQFHNSIFICEK